MVFKCQTDSYLKEFKSKVVSCQSSEFKHNKQKLNGFDVVLEDTILFPEGGGQPNDFGTIDEKPVINVRRNGEKAIHFVISDNPFAIDQEVCMKVDWKRRFDHMQQHSGQHLITAIADKMFSLPTTSWNLGEEVSFIELDSPNISDETINQLEIIVNEKIRSSLPVNVTLFDKNDKDLDEVRTRLELPEDQTGPIRVVSIEGVDRNTCCGTHVSNLNDLQAIKLLYVEKGKKNKSNLYFLCGNRLLSYMDKCVKREKSLISSLKCSSDEFVPMVEKLKKSLKLSQKNCLNAMRDLAKLEAQKFLDLEPKPKFYSIHRKESDTDFITIFINEVKNAINDSLVVISVTDDSINPNSSGQITLAGNPALVQQFSSKVSEMLTGKGALKDGKFQAKVANLSKRSKVDEMIKNELESNGL